MTEKTKNNLRKGVGIFLSVWTVVVGLAFIVQVWRIYSHGDEAFTVERIAEHFRQIAVPVYIWIAAVIIGGVFFCIYPAPKTKTKPQIELACTLARLSKRLPADTKEMKKWQKQRFVAYVSCAIVLLTCCVMSLVYMLADVKLSAKNGFLAEHTEAERFIRALVWFTAAIALAIGTGYFLQGLYKKEITAVKTEIAENAKNGIKAAQREEERTLKTVLKEKFAFLHSKWCVLGVRVAIAVTAVVFVITGIFNGGVLAVWEKGVNICKQCIGIG